MWSVALFAWWRGKLRARIFGSLRVALYLGCVSAVVTLLCVSRAKAKLDEYAFKFSKDLLPIADLLEGATGMRLNGELINLSVTTVPDTTVASVLDRIEKNCREHPGPLPLRLRELAERVPGDLPGAQRLRRLIDTAALSREESDGHGAVLCFTSHNAAAPMNLDSETSDLAAFGNLRYVVATQGSAETKDAGSTQIISLWTEGSFRLHNLEPPLLGDTPGSDSLALPRPPHSTRVFSAEAVGAPYAVRLYETDDLPEAVLAYYDERMRDSNPISMPGYEDKGRGFVKNAQPLLLNVSRDADEKTIVTLSELGAVTPDLTALRR